MTDHERIRLDNRLREAAKPRRPRRSVTQAAAEAVARAQQLANAWEHAPPRQPRHGHRADCPDRLTGRVRRCRHCIADVIGAEPRVDLVNKPRDITPGIVNDGPDQALRACPTCFGPTTDPEGHCP